MTITLLDPALDQYIHDHSTPRDPLFDALREVTYATMPGPGRQVGSVEGALLALLCRITGARRVLEIGTFTGFSALAMAEALPDDGVLITCDVDPEAAGVAQSFFDRSPHGRKIQVRLAPALETIAALPDAPFDLAFIDADKDNYTAYYEAILPRMRQGGLVVADNTLWRGKVLAPSEESDHAIVRFNAHVHADPRVENVLLSVRDGMMLAYKR